MLFTQFLVEVEDKVPPQEPEKPEVVPAAQKPKLNLRKPPFKEGERFYRPGGRPLKHEPFDGAGNYKGVPYDQVAKAIKRDYEADTGRNIDDIETVTRPESRGTSTYMGNAFKVNNREDFENEMDSLRKWSRNMPKPSQFVEHADTKEVLGYYDLPFEDILKYGHVNDQDYTLFDETGIFHHPDKHGSELLGLNPTGVLDYVKRGHGLDSLGGWGRIPDQQPGDFARKLRKYFENEYNLEDGEDLTRGIDNFIDAIYEHFDKMPDRLENVRHDQLDFEDYVIDQLWQNYTWGEGSGPYGHDLQDFLRNPRPKVNRFGEKYEYPDNFLPAIYHMIKSSEYRPEREPSYISDYDRHEHNNFIYTNGGGDARMYYRGISDSDEGGDDGFLWGRLKDGDMLYDPAFSSISTDDGVAGDFGHGGIMMEILGWNEDVPGATHGIHYKPWNPHQYERVLMPNVPLTYRGRNKKTDAYMFDMPNINRYEDGVQLQ